MTNPIYEIRLMFEWGGGCLWGMNANAEAEYGYARIEQSLPISAQTRSNLGDFGELHDTALNWSDPASPSQWSAHDFELFEVKALRVLEDLRAELGASYHIYYTPLGRR